MSPEEVFAGKVVQVFAESPARGGMFENVRIEKLEGRAFIVGTLAEHPSGSDLRVGLPFWVALDAVQMFAIFPDLSEAQRYYENHLRNERWEGKRRRRWWQR